MRWGLYFAFRSLRTYLYGVTSVTWVTMEIRGTTCGLRADQETSRVPVGLSDWPPKCGAVRLA